MITINNLTLNYSRTLEYFEGEILSEYIGDSRVFLKKWCDMDDQNNQTYLLVESTPEIIQSYLEKQISMHELLKCHQKQTPCWLVKMQKGQTVEVTSSTMELVPQLYKPSDLAYYDESLSIN